jgi:DNA-binding transcriptional regulator YiaG
MNGDIAKTSGTMLRQSLLASSIVRGTIFGALLFAGVWGACTSAMGNVRLPTTERTSAQPAGKLLIQIADSTSAGIMEVRRLTGFSWDQLADLFSVSRRSVHLWASGGGVSAHKEERLFKVLSALRRMSDGDAQSLRAKLLTADRSGQTTFDLLKSGEFDLLPFDLDDGQLPSSRIALSPEQSIARRPTSVAVALDLDEAPVTLPSMTSRIIRPLRKG